MSRYMSSRYQSLEPYVPGEQPRNQRFIKLNTNESPYPPSEKVVTAITAAEIKKLRLYSDPDAHELREALAQTYGVSADSIIVGNGSDELLSLAFMAYGDRGAAYPDITYGFYRVLAGLYGLDAMEIPLDESFGICPEDYMNLHRMIVIANPNAPTGRALPVYEIERIAAANPDFVVLVDEAYVDFGGESSLPLIEKYENILVVRTYSKSRQLAGARLGFAFARPEMVADLNALRCSINPYNVNRLTLLAGQAALQDDIYFRECCKRIIETRESTAKALRAMGFELTDSRANFLFAKHPAVPGAELLDGLRAKGILVRHWDTPRIRDYLRITVGAPEEMEALTAALQELI